MDRGCAHRSMDESKLSRDLTPATRGVPSTCIPPPRPAEVWTVSARGCAMPLALSRPGSCRRLVSDLVRTLQRKKRSVIGRTRDWGLVSAAAPASPPPAAAGSWAQRWRIPAMKPSLAPYRPHEPLMCLVAGSRAWHGGASGGSVRGVASALLSDDESKAQRATSYLAPRTSHPPPTCHLPPATSHLPPPTSHLPRPTSRL